MGEVQNLCLKSFEDIGIKLLVLIVSFSIIFCEGLISLCLNILSVRATRLVTF